MSNCLLDFRCLDKHLKILMLSFCLLSGFVNASGQNVEKVGGVVVGKDGPIPGVSVVVRGTLVGTTTDENGRFSLSDVGVGEVLVFSFVGMKAQEVSVDGDASLSVVMVEDVVGLEEVVAIGYGTKKRVNLTSAISTVKSEEILTTTHTSMASRLQGKVSGLQIRQNSGQPGTFDAAISIRGFGSPLYVIDGIQTDVGEFQRLTPEDIETVSVLKDAAASAIYGARAPYGVILIT